MLLLAALLAAQLGTPEVSDVRLSRGQVICSASVHYRLPLSDVALRGAVGDPSRVLDASVPCARLDAVDALLPLPDALGGKLSVRTDEVHMQRGPDGLCSADLLRTLTPTNPDVLEARGSSAVSQRIASVPCTRLTQALVGAVVTKRSAAGWPSRLVAVPLAVEP